MAEPCTFCKRRPFFKRGSKRSSMRGSTSCTCDYRNLCDDHACTFEATLKNRLLRLLNIDIYEPWRHA